jgi:predicted HTH transcriptional regulator
LENAVADMVAAGEGPDREFKSTLRANLHTGQADPRIELSVLKTVAAFLNSQGGILVIGVIDDGSAVGFAADKFKSEDGMGLHLVNLIKDRIGAYQMMFIHPRFDDFQDVRVLVVECKPSQTPVYVKDGNSEHFYIRAGASTVNLTASQMAPYLKQRFG